MSFILFDQRNIRENLKPFTFTRPTAEIRCGILTISDKWEHYLNSKGAFLTADYLSKKFPSSSANLYINGAVCPNKKLVMAIKELQNEEVLISNDIVIAVKTTKKLEFDFEIKDFKKFEFESEITVIRNLPDIFIQNGEQIKADFELLTTNKKSALIKDPFTRVYAPENVFLEDGAIVKAAILNAENGPIYIGKDAQIQEGAIVIGPCFIGEGSIVAWGSKVRMNTSIGHHCRVGGEVGNSVFFAYSNKAHDGFLGNSVIGEWCNLGANTNNSNLKNDYTNVKLYNYGTDKLEDTGTQFCGLFMGDYTKAGISTMFNTGTVVGVNVNVFGAGFQDKHIPSFTWGGAAEGYSEYRFDKAIQVINETMKRRNMSLSEEDLKILQKIEIGKSI
jgi:UDP-N-acetylglucosamine diphosphorylase / glucose-1-phosphate thymidylyltransferase / UDP-N-acetylgalactosamine diphosphorylase / glucosamine-1-phosphate N-acetyltransferase / galactosamine-1-phosphate N-acetyltransferase